MVLTYEFDVAPPGSDETQAVIPRVAALHDQLYDSPVDSMIWRLEAANTGAVLAHGGLIHEAAKVSLRKGSYVVRVLLRHPEIGLLESLKELPLLLTMPLPKPVELKVQHIPSMRAWFASMHVK